MIILHPQHDNKLAVTSLSVDQHDLPAELSKSITQYMIVDTLDIINDFFDAYEYDPVRGAVLNIKKAKNIKIDQFRCARKPLLAQLDISFMRAVEASNEVERCKIALIKQQLRDVTDIDLPDDADELAKFWPDVLKAA